MKTKLTQKRNRPCGEALEDGILHEERGHVEEHQNAPAKLSGEWSFMSNPSQHQMEQKSCPVNSENYEK